MRDLDDLMDDPEFMNTVHAISDVLPSIIEQSDSRTSGSHHFEDPDVYGNMTIDADVDIVSLSARIMQIVDAAFNQQ